MKKQSEWSLEKVQALTRHYDKRSNFQDDHGSAYHWAKSNNLLNESFPHLEPLVKKGHWKKKENVLAEAKKHRTRAEFRRASRAAYNMARDNNWEEVFNLFEDHEQARKWDSKDKVVAEAKKYITRTEFQQKSSGAWRVAKENGWEEAFAHMDVKARPSGYWEDYDNCKEAAFLCASKMEMRERFRTGYETIKAHGWDELFDHMIDPRIGRKAHNIGEEAKEKGWCLDTIQHVADRYTSRSQFEKERPAVYKAASELGVLDEVCTHMKPLGNHFKRSIYSIEFADGSVYVGLSYSVRVRIGQHKRKSSNPDVRKRMDENMPYRVVEHMHLLSPEIAQREEKNIAQKYINSGYCLLNRGKLGGGGSLGGGGGHRTEKRTDELHDIKWSKTKVLNVARQCKTRTEFKKKYSGAWRHAHHHGYLDECHKIIPPVTKPNGYWLKASNIILAADGCKNRYELKRKYPTAYRRALEFNMLDNLFPK